MRGIARKKKWKKFRNYFERRWKPTYRFREESNLLHEKIRVYDEILDDDDALIEFVDRAEKADLEYFKHRRAYTDYAVKLISFVVMTFLILFFILNKAANMDKQIAEERKQEDKIDFAEHDEAYKDQSFMRHEVLDDFIPLEGDARGNFYSGTVIIYGCDWMYTVMGKILSFVTSCVPEKDADKVYLRIDRLMVRLGFVYGSVKATSMVEERDKNLYIQGAVELKGRIP